MKSGRPPCGNKVQSGKIITPHFLGKFKPVISSTWHPKPLEANSLSPTSLVLSETSPTPRLNPCAHGHLLPNTVVSIPTIRFNLSMPRISSLWLISYIAAYAISCTPIPKTPLSSHPPSPSIIKEPTTEGPPLKTPTTLTEYPVSPPRLLSETLSNIQFYGVSFDSRSHALKTIDQSNGPGSEYFDARDCATKHEALLAINAGFFTPEGNPLGLVISRGKRSGSWNSGSSLGSGIYRIDPSGNASISRRSRVGAVSDSRELLQAGPLLIENYKPITGLDQSKIAMRSILLHDGRHRWWVGITSPCSLASLGQALNMQSATGWKISDALNLDGGRSTDLYVSSKISGKSLERKSLMNRQVRNFLILK
jgi:hypothetical protein